MQTTDDCVGVVDQLALQSEGLSGAEIALVCREAGLAALARERAIETLSAAEIRVDAGCLTAALAAVKRRGNQSSSREE